MHKRIVFIVALFLALFPLCVHAVDSDNSSTGIINCRYNYKTSSSVDTTFDISYNLQEKKVLSYKISNDDSKFPSEIVNFDFDSSSFKSSEIAYCPLIYMSHLINDKTTRLHIYGKYSQGLTIVTGKIINSQTDNSNYVKTTIKTDLFDSNCADFADTLKIGGLILFFVKIILPLIIIVRASIDMFSVVTSGDSSEFGKKMKKLGISLVSAVLIFFVPTIVSIIFGVVTNMRDTSSTGDIEVCKACLFEPLSGQCISTKEKEKME